MPADTSSPHHSWDPLAHVFEVARLDEGGGATLFNSTGRWLHVTPAQLTPGLVLTPGLRVTSVHAGAGDCLVPLRPDPHELEQARRFLAELRAAGLEVRGDPDGLLIERLRAARFGQPELEPLAVLLRRELLRCVGAVPAEDAPHHAGSVEKQLRALLAALGVAAPSFAPAGEEDAVESLVRAANLALAQAQSPLRLMECVRVETNGESRRLWLLLTPTVARHLEQASHVRLGVSARDQEAKGEDPRTLCFGVPFVASPLERMKEPANEPVTPTQGGGSLHTPCKARIARVSEVDGVGELVTEDGVTVSFGGTACQGFVPREGLWVWLVEAGPHPLGRGHRAKVLNLSGEPSPDRLTRAVKELHDHEAHRDSERELLRAFGLPPEGDIVRPILALGDARRRELATALVELALGSHVFDAPFAVLATVDPGAFYAHLGALDPAREPGALAFVGAPFAAVRHLVPWLERGPVTRLREALPAGAYGPRTELERRLRAPVNELGVALLTLARSGAPEAVAAIEAWLPRELAPLEEVQALLALAGFTVHEGRLRRTFRAEAATLTADETGSVTLFTRATARCGECREPLVELVRDGRGVAPALPWVTCVRCAVAGFDWVTVVTSDAGTPVWFECSGEGAAKDFGVHLPHPWKARLTPAPTSVPANPGGALLDRVGGAPSYHHGPVTPPRCPNCGVPLSFYAQLGDDDGRFGSDGALLWAYGCEPCGVVATRCEPL